MPRSKYSAGLEGTRFGRLVLKVFAYQKPSSKKSNSYYWISLCDCGTWHVVNARSAFRGMVKSCGCLHREGPKPIHGHASPYGQSREYVSWRKMKGRVDNPKNEWYHRYGGRGIRCCEGFRSFPHFLSTVGPRPENHTLDRVNNDGHYSCGSCEQCLTNNWPMNVRWATPKEQSANRTYPASQVTVPFQAQPEHLD